MYEYCKQLTLNNKNRCNMRFQLELRVWPFKVKNDNSHTKTSEYDYITHGLICSQEEARVVFLKGSRIKTIKFNVKETYE
jgi:hypothetical protein